MKITKQDDKIIVEIPIWQDMLDYFGEVNGKIHNVVGVIIKSQKDDSGDFEQGIYQLIDMSYKGKDPQLGSPIIMTEMNDDDFRKLCEDELKIDVWEFEKCFVCDETLFGTHTIDREGRSICCEHND